MGEHADDFVDRLIFGWWDRPSKLLERKTFQSGTGNYMWRTVEKVIPMDFMDIPHLKNAINLCAVKGNEGKKRQLQEVLARKLRGSPEKPKKGFKR